MTFDLRCRFCEMAGCASIRAGDSDPGFLHRLRTGEGSPISASKGDNALLQDFAVGNLLLSIGLALWSVMDLQRRPPAMAVMKWVWPLTFLWGGLFALAMYLWFGRAPAMMESEGHHQHGHGHGHGGHPFWQSVALGATHCGAGCSLADVLVESAMFGLGIEFVVWGHAVFGTWMVDYVAALVIGVIFQYAAQAPMSDEPRARVLWNSFRSDVLSLTCWQIGMYGWMAISIFVLFPGGAMHPNHWLFWWMMQVAMLFGFLTAYPANWVLIRLGVKETM
jgi:hypothetical protein